MQKKLKELLEKYHAKGMSYTTYLNLVDSLFAEGKSTGTTQNETYLHYTSLGIQRMKRWNKKGTIAKFEKDKLEGLNKKQTWLVISEGWCGDAAHALPFIYKLTELSEYVALKIVLRDENEELMKQFLTNGGKSIPKLIAFDEDYTFLFTWGPRPQVLSSMVAEEKKKNEGVLNELFKAKLQQWFNKDKGNSTVSELVNLSIEAAQKTN